MRRRGFTLLEVMVAVAILGLGLSAIFAAQAGSFASVKHARHVSEATGLARCKMSELELEIAKEGFQVTDQTGSGPCCEGAETSVVTCTWSVEKPEFPAGNFGELNLDADLDLGGNAGPSFIPGLGGPGGTTGGPSALGFLNTGKTGFSQGGDVGGIADMFASGSEQSVADGLASTVMSMVYPDLKAFFEAGTRRVTVKVAWREGAREHGFELMQWVTSSRDAGLAGNMNGLLDTEEVEP